jgi:thioredoxin:protein disulfide reductase
MTRRTVRGHAIASLCTLALVAGPAGAAPGLNTPDELLDPQKAFRISTRVLEGRKVEVEFKIADGYYLYRDRFRFASESGEPLAEVEIPRGKVKQDPLFGKTETFRDLVRIRVTVSPKDAANGSVTLKVTLQGCADGRVCYAPLEQIVKVRLPAAVSNRDGR